MSEFVEITYDGATYPHLVYSPNYLILRAEKGMDNYGFRRRGDVFPVLKEDVAAKPELFRGAVGAVKKVKAKLEEPVTEEEPESVEGAEPPKEEPPVKAKPAPKKGG